MGAHISIPTYQRTLDQRLAFIAERCTECDALHFPPKAMCMDCGANDEFDEVPLSSEGTVYSYTVISPGGAPPEFAEQAKVEGRYAIAIVELAEGPMITGQLTGIDPDAVEIGLEVVGEIRRIYEEEGVVRYGFKFGPK